MYTILLDLDGCVFKHVGNLSNTINHPYKNNPEYLLPGVREKFNEWAGKGYNIIITTGRPESMRNFTHAQLEYYNLFYDQLVMGLKYFPRIVINDEKPDGTETARGICIIRNVGLEDINV